VAFPSDLADPDPVAAPAFPDGPLSPRAALVVLAVPLAPSGVLVAPAARVVPVAPVALAAVGPVAPAVRAAPRGPTTAALPLPRLPCGWPRRHGVAPPA
jgi:hypothetical protein